MKTKKFLLAFAMMLTTFSFADTVSEPTNPIENHHVYINSSNSGSTFDKSSFAKGNSVQIGTGSNEYTEKKIMITFPSKLNAGTGDTSSPNVILDNSTPLGNNFVTIPIKNTGEYYLYMTSVGPKGKLILDKKTLGLFVTKNTTNIVSAMDLEDVVSNAPTFFYLIPKDKFKNSDNITLQSKDLQKYLARDKDGNVIYIIPRVNSNFVKGFEDNGNVFSNYLGKGNVEVMNLPRYAQYGEIKAQTEANDSGSGVNYAKDRANWFVSGATVYDYLHHNGNNVTPYLKDMDPATLNDLKEKLGIKELERQIKELKSEIEKLKNNK